MKMPATDFRFYKFVIISKMFVFVCVCGLRFKAALSFHLNIFSNPTNTYLHIRKWKKNKKRNDTQNVLFSPLIRTACSIFFCCSLIFMFVILFVAFLSIKLNVCVNASVSLVEKFFWISMTKVQPKQQQRKPNDNNKIMRNHILKC